jgi:hypothetical protein
MQIIQSKQNIIEKIIRDKEGRLVRARFCIYESAGRIKARLLDFTYIAEQTLLTGGSFILNGYAQTKSFFAKVFKQKIFSNFDVTEILFFTGSKPRAPSFI